MGAETAIKPFKIEIAEEVLGDLRERLSRTRLAPPSPLAPWEQGTDAEALADLLKSWQHAYDWRDHEAILNGFDQFQVPMETGQVHFIHQRSTHPNARPLLIVHGWPGGVYEFYKLIPMLTQPEKFGGSAEQAFHVIAPSLPGYGFSDAPQEPGWSPRRVAGLFHQLMTEQLGYSDYIVQGGDWGAVVASWVAHDHSCAGLHLNMVGLRPHLDETVQLTEEESAFLRETRRSMQQDMAYQAIQGTRPQSLGYGLQDSPAGLAGWLLEKYRAWSDCSGKWDGSISRDEILTLLTLYWVTGTITSSMRLYYEYRKGDESLTAGQRVACPTGFASFPGEIYRPPRSWVERAYNVVQWADMPSGGHFAALERPKELAAELGKFKKKIENN